MGDVANAMDIGVFHLLRALPPRELGKIRHKPLDEPFEEGHRDDDGHRRQASDKQTHVHQVLIDGLRISAGRNGVGRDGEPPHHPWMTVAHFFAQVVHDLRARVVRASGDIGARHPINEISLQHRGVPGNDSAALGG